MTPQPPARRDPLQRVRFPFILALAFLVMTLWTWGTWPDAIYDFGSQLYYPWQITRGKTLYTDIAYFNGPLSQYFNALAFFVFGTSLRTLVWLNLTILVGVLILIFRLMQALSNSFTAATACLVFILIFAFGQYVGIGNYNWICPYTHEVTHGIALSFASITAMMKFQRSSQKRWLYITGTLLGLIFLTKAEIFAPVAAALGVGLLLTPNPGQRGDRFSNHLFNFSITILGAILPILLTFILLSKKMPLTAATRALLGSWPWVFDSRIAHLQFYRQGLGIDDLSGNLFVMLEVSAVYGIILLLTYLAAKFPHRLRGLAYLIAGSLAGSILLGWQSIPQIARPWPVFIALIAIVSIIQARKNRGSILRATLALFALGLMGKMLLNARIVQYGFALAMPGALLLVDALLNWGPNWIASRRGNPSIARAIGLSLIAAVVSVHLYAAHLFIHGKTRTVGEGPDQFLAGSRGVEVEMARQAIDHQFPSDTTLAIMPQGLMLNYLTRRNNSTPFVNLMPPEMLSAGEDRVLSALIANPPDVIVLTRKDLGENSFVLTEGHYEYGQKIRAWVIANYQQLGMLKKPDGSNPELGLLFYKRK